MDQVHACSCYLLYTAIHLHCGVKGFVHQVFTFCSPFSGQETIDTHMSQLSSVLVVFERRYRS